MNYYEKLLLALLFLTSVEAHSVETQEIPNKLHKSHYEFMQGKKMYDNPELLKYVRQVGQKVVDNSDKPNKKFHKVFYLWK